MTESDSNPVLLSDYVPPPYLIDQIGLIFELDHTHTRVTARSVLRRNSVVNSSDSSIRLDGENLVLDSVRIDGRPVDEHRLNVGKDSLTIKEVPDCFNLEIVTIINPSKNKALEGLYITNERFCTQCEAEGFRRITYFLDRPDILAIFEVEIRANQKEFPVLLSNGNLTSSGVLENGRHFCIWADPFPKPCYLFALVAGKFGRIDNHFTTNSGKPVSLRIFLEPGKEGRARYAMECLIQAMRWDERTYDLEYDLDQYNIVAVSDFNMGAMENKSLNIFNDKYVLANPETTTDSDYANIESVIAHEYFHNWTGNRVTCRDWFQLSLKEGLTVYRDQQFSADMRSAVVQRIEDVMSLRAAQFPEDASPLAHPVRPESYIEVNNFYTHTVYEKGAEVVRMICTIIGASLFKKGIDLYFERHDGQAVTCEDFLQAMSDASGFCLDQFMRWYKNPGTPVVKFDGAYHSATGTYALHVSQELEKSNTESSESILMIPIRLGFIDSLEGELCVTLEGGDNKETTNHTLLLQEREKTFTFHDLPKNSRAPTLSLNRGFAAPIIINIDRPPEELGTLIERDTDEFVRWDAAQELVKQILVKNIQGRTLEDDLEIYLSALCPVFEHAHVDPAETALILAIPEESVIAESMPIIDPDAIYQSRNWIKRVLVEAFETKFERLYEAFEVERPYEPVHKDASARALRNLALSYLVHEPQGKGLARALQHYKNTDNMTDWWAALKCMNNFDCNERVQALSDFSTTQTDPLVLEKSLSQEHTSYITGNLDRLRLLLKHTDYDKKNPNRIRSLVGSFAHSNAVRFHDKSGQGYDFVASQILEIDVFNPQVAARLTWAFQKWARYDQSRRDLMQHQLERIRAHLGISPDVREIAERSLAVS